VAPHLQGVRGDLVGQADAAALLLQVDDDARRVGLDELQRQLQLL
jgi:hypothetical protein